MAKIAFLLLCHTDPAGIARQARSLAAAGDAVAIHLDARAPAADHAHLRAATRDAPDIVLVRRPVRCDWGHWSLVRATLITIRTALDAVPDATHLYLVSGACRPITSAAHLHAALDAHDIDRIESVDAFTSNWVLPPAARDRLAYRHPVGRRRAPRLFDVLLSAQKTLGLDRRPPADIDVMIGAQWWCLRRDTARKILAFAKSRRDVARYFSTTWIPDETFFQTLVRHLIPREEIAGPPTLHIFGATGRPVTFHDDHHDLLLGQDRFFARKISPDATDLH
ncbi:MAG: beta-1,6-N-acetylglucosaminyltransferase, partial [Pseudomonadota bacterium]